MLTMKTMLTIETYYVIMLTLSSYRATERGAMAGKHAIRATQKSSAGYCQERAGRATARVPTTPLHCPRPYNDGDSRERVERLLRSPERAIEGPLLRSSTGIASDRYVWCFLFKTRCDRTTASVLARSANDAGASTDCVSQAERKAPISY